VQDKSVIVGLLGKKRGERRTEEKAFKVIL